MSKWGLTRVNRNKAFWTPFWTPVKYYLCKKDDMKIGVTFKLRSPNAAESVIMCTITAQSRKVRMSTGQSIPSGLWNPTERRPYSNSILKEKTEIAN